MRITLNDIDNMESCIQETLRAIEYFDKHYPVVVSVDNIETEEQQQNISRARREYDRSLLILRRMAYDYQTLIEILKSEMAIEFDIDSKDARQRAESAVDFAIEWLKR